jgi:hypothetical protein
LDAAASAREIPVAYVAPSAPLPTKHVIALDALHLAAVWKPDKLTLRSDAAQRELIDALLIMPFKWHVRGRLLAAR